MLDLRELDALGQVGLAEGDIADEDWTACQAVGQAAWFLGLDGLLAPSATREGTVLAAFEIRAAPALEVIASRALEPATFAEWREGGM